MFNSTNLMEESVIAGGTQLYSKHPSLFKSDKWPTYFTKAKGVEL